MNQSIKDALNDLALSIVKGLSVIVKSYLPAILIGVILSPEFRDFALNHPALAVYLPLLSVIATVTREFLKLQNPDNKTIQKL